MADRMWVGRRVAYAGAAAVVAAWLLVGAGGGADAHGGEQVFPDWKGAETFAPVSIGPDEDCGPFPQNVRAQFVGSGIDTVGGPFTVVVSGCLDTEARRLEDLSATDTFLRRPGSSIRVVPGDTDLVVDPETCTATNPGPVRFTVTGGTGVYEDANGEGTYHLAFTWPPLPGGDCPGPAHVGHVWFSGVLRVAE